MFVLNTIPVLVLINFEHNLFDVGHSVPVLEVYSKILSSEPITVILSYATETYLHPVGDPGNV